MRSLWFAGMALATLAALAPRAALADEPAVPAPPAAAPTSPTPTTAVPNVPGAAPATPDKPVADKPVADKPAAPHGGSNGHALGDVATVRFKPGTGAVLTSKDERFSLTLRARMQVRYDVEIPHEEGEEPEQTFQLRRMRLVFAGHAFGEHNKFYVQLGLSPRDQTGGLLEGEPQIRYNPVRDARIELDYLRDATLMVGQMKVPFSRQRVISSGNLEMVDRSSVNEELQLDRDLGIQVLSKDLFGLNRLAYSLGVFLGEGRNAFEPSDSGMLWVARAEWLPFGRFEDYAEGDLTRMTKPGLSLGVAYAFHDNANGMRSVHGKRPADGGTTDYHHVTADAMFKYRGLSTQLAFHYRDGTRTPGDATDEDGAAIPAEAPRNGVGFLAQIGYMLPWFDLQAVGRYGMVRSADPETSSMPGRNELGGGLGYYFGGHAYKVQVDYTRLWDEVTSGQSQAFETGTDRVRAQIQLSL